MHSQRGDERLEPPRPLLAELTATLWCLAALLAVLLAAYWLAAAIYST
jgi:hypothetical protein